MNNFGKILHTIKNTQKSRKLEIYEKGIIKKSLLDEQIHSYDDIAYVQCRLEKTFFFITKIDSLDMYFYLKNKKGKDLDPIFGFSIGFLLNGLAGLERSGVKTQIETVNILIERGNIYNFSILGNYNEKLNEGGDYGLY